jgi:hypothetical protein
MRFNWVRDRVLANWLMTWVQIGGRDRHVFLTSETEQPEYWLLFRGDGNRGLICGPTDEAGAIAFAERWLEQNGAIQS